MNRFKLQMITTSMIRFVFPRARLMGLLLLAPAGAPQPIPAQHPVRWQALDWSGEFARIPSGRILPGGILIVDPGESELILETHSGADTVAVRDGEGPQEVKRLSSVSLFKGDSSLIFGRDKLRAVVVDGRGKPVRTITFHRFNSDSMFLLSFQGADSAGRMAYISPRVREGKHDSADVVLIDTDSMTATNVATIWYPPPSGVFADQSEKSSGRVSQRDQIWLLPSGRLVIYRPSSVDLVVLDLWNRGSRRLALPNQDRPMTSRERRLIKEGKATARARVDSIINSVPEKVRSRIAASLLAGFDQAVGDHPVPAYASDGLVALSDRVVSLPQGVVALGDSTVYDWINTDNGRHGSFTIPTGIRLLCGGFGRVLLARATEPDGFGQVAEIPLAMLLGGTVDQ